MSNTVLNLPDAIENSKTGGSKELSKAEATATERDERISMLLQKARRILETCYRQKLTSFIGFRSGDGTAIKGCNGSRTTST